MEELDRVEEDEVEEAVYDVERIVDRRERKVTFRLEYGDIFHFLNILFEFHFQGKS